MLPESEDLLGAQARQPGDHSQESRQSAKLASDHHRLAGDPWDLVSRHIDPLAPGSYLALSAPTADHKVESTVDRVVEEYAGTSAGGNWPRTKDEIERFFAGLEFEIPYPGAKPGVTYVGLWGCDDPEVADDDASRWFYVGVARKPPEMRF